MSRTRVMQLALLLAALSLAGCAGLSDGPGGPDGTVLLGWN